MEATVTGHMEGYVATRVRVVVSQGERTAGGWQGGHGGKKQRRGLLEGKATERLRHGWAQDRLERWAGSRPQGKWSLDNQDVL